MKMVNASSPSRPILSFTIRSVKSIQVPVPGAGIVMVVPLVKSVSEEIRSSTFNLNVQLPCKYVGKCTSVNPRDSAYK